MAEHQLPPALAGDQRFAQLCELLTENYAALDVAALAVYLVDQVKAPLLPVLAEQFSLLDEAAWQLAESDEARRKLLNNAITLHRYKGTPWSIREVVRRLGFGEISILEGLGGLPYDGQANFDGLRVYGASGSWPVYRVFLNQAITNDQAELLRRVLRSIAPARCRLASLEYTAVPIRYNQVAAYDGQYNYGSS
ncbi:phage tail protein I [Pseudomonas sp. 5P_3.1_Bac2]|uniref:phage tail protein I n=1 Tax=Pseudomonas sp. 5P_3.1_Bac2 TaxID=2971617 RepID=UPI0021C8F849|nr:phage tail protein I [Pseudomonas sp. 5P_3.1_Bac2]MCU1718678.1 phage tail protein I [Pseudomonas sp. 5P_3.1_Bac2]